MSNRHQFENSSSLSHCDYIDAEGKMHVCFTSGHTYEYKCDKATYEALKAAQSPGKHFHANIKTKITGKKI